MKTIIKDVLPGSIAEEMEIVPGDIIVKINDIEPEDIFDYQYLMEDVYVELLIQKADGEEWLLEIEKEEAEDIGITFENGLMDEYRSCCNHCIFCFIDQMPAGMRPTLYFKDDDSRLSFLQGNYVTLTNMTDHDIERIIQYRLAPINISVHTTNPKLRCQMLHNRFAGDALKKIDLLYEAGIPMNGQIVLCPGINDGEELERTIKDLSRYLPHMESVSVVPVGLTKHRKGLYPLKGLTKESAAKIIDIIEGWQKKLYKKHQLHFIHASDEFYILAEREMPGAGQYDNYIQLSNGVGMVRLFLDETEEYLSSLVGDNRKRCISLATGLLMKDYIKQVADRITEKFPGITIRIYPIINRFFGEEITVSGLITGQDLTAQLSGRPLGERLLLPANMFRGSDEVFLDDISKEEVSQTLQVAIDIVKSSGRDFVAAIIGECLDEETAEELPHYEI